MDSEWESNLNRFTDKTSIKAVKTKFGIELKTIIKESSNYLKSSNYIKQQLEVYYNGTTSPFKEKKQYRLEQTQ